MIYKTSIEESNKILMTDIQEDLNKWKDITYSGTRRPDIIKMSTLPKSLYSFTIITNKMSRFKHFGCQIILKWYGSSKYQDQLENS